jgi:hypothetical protein
MGTRERAYLRGRSGVWMGGVALVIAAACSGKSDDRPPTTATGATGGSGMFPKGAGGAAGSTGGKAGRGGSGGSSGSENEGGGAGEPVTDPNGPVVEVTSPEAVSDPDDGGVIVEPEVNVVCQARPASGGEPVDASSVAIQLLDADDNVVEEVAAAPTGEVDQYSANVIVEQVDMNGVIGFRCIAADTSSPPLLGSHTVKSFVDHGPLIQITSPVPDSAHALAQALRVRFSVNPAPVARSDAAAAIDTVTLYIAGVPIDPGTPDEGDYDVSVNLAEPMDFGNVLSGTVPITIRATNRRDPAAERAVNYGFVIDGEGPIITVKTPEEGDVVGGQVPVTFTVVDALSAVDVDSIVVQVNQSRYFYDSVTWGNVGDEFTFMMDSTEAEEFSKVQAQITIRADDEVGNAATERTFNLYLDNVPPTVDLDPENVRDTRRNSDVLTCSGAFDPVGDRAANDYPKLQYSGEIPVTRTPTLRAIVWEETNYVPGIPLLNYATVDPSTVRIYLQPDVETPLLIDESGDGVCDNVDPTQYVQNLFQLSAAGEAWYRAGDELANPPTEGTCTLVTMDEAEPTHRCSTKTSDMIRIIPHQMDDKPPVIYAIAPTLDGSGCTGTYWEIATAATEGWVCLAGVASDFAGNLGVSTPLRLCYDDPDTDFEPSCASGLETPPSCTDGCTPPPHYTSRIFIEP